MTSLRRVRGGDVLEVVGGFTLFCAPVPIFEYVPHPYGLIVGLASWALLVWSMEDMATRSK